MPHTRLSQKSRAKYVTVKEFQNQYSLSQAQAYRILAMNEMQEAVMRAGEKSIRVNLDLAFEIMQKIFR